MKKIKVKHDVSFPVHIGPYVLNGGEEFHLTDGQFADWIDASLVFEGKISVSMDLREGNPEMSSLVHEEIRDTPTGCENPTPRNDMSEWDEK